MDASDILRLALIFLTVYVCLLIIAVFVFRRKVWFWFKMFRDLARWSLRIWQDPDAPVAMKLAPLVVLAYFIFPIDVLPDVVPLLGQLDDLGLLVLALHFLLGPDQLKRFEGSWKGSPATLNALRALGLRKRDTSAK